MPTVFVKGPRLDPGLTDPVNVTDIAEMIGTSGKVVIDITDTNSSRYIIIALYSDCNLFYIYLVYLHSYCHR